jgi:hypothetical protein
MLKLYKKFVFFLLLNLLNLFNTIIVNNSPNNNKAKSINVNIHLRKIIACTNIYHIGVSFSKHPCYLRFDFHSSLIDNKIIQLSINELETTINWGYTNKTFNEIIEFEESINKYYIIGLYDCRHYTQQITQWATHNKTPIWNLSKLI